MDSCCFLNTHNPCVPIWITKGVIRHPGEGLRAIRNRLFWTRAWWQTFACPAHVSRVLPAVQRRLAAAMGGSGPLHAPSHADEPGRDTNGLGPLKRQVPFSAVHQLVGVVHNRLMCRRASWTGCGPLGCSEVAPRPVQKAGLNALKEMQKQVLNSKPTFTM